MLAPLSGIVIYVLLYFIATLFYPGGSQFDKHSQGFSWKQNYWCNLLNEQAINGAPNTARPLALTALLVLCITLMVFWYIFPRHVPLKKSGRLAIQVSGVASMVTAMFLFTAYHDLIINIATFFGLIALAGTFAGLYKLKWRKLLWLGLFITVLIILNNILYYGNGLMVYLPVVQKITFFNFLFWICLINVHLYRMKQSVAQRG